MNKYIYLDYCFDLIKIYLQKLLFYNNNSILPRSGRVRYIMHYFTFYIVSFVIYLDDMQSKSIKKWFHSYVLGVRTE